MRKKLMTLLLVLMIAITCVSCVSAGSGNKNSTTHNNSTSNSQQLQILRSDLKLSQDQVQSQIKAEYLKANNGYLDSDEIIAIITLSEKSLIEDYIDGVTSAKSVAEYASSDKGDTRLQVIKAQQDALIADLLNYGLIESVEYTYSAVINAIAVKTTYGDFNKIEKLASIEAALIADTFNMPQTTDASAIVNPVDVYDTGIFNSGSVDYTGKGTSVAILDSGFDCSHSVFAYQPDTDKLALNKQDIDAVLSETNAYQLTSGLTVEGANGIDGVWYSTKIPYKYDYADKDSDVFPYDSEHGTHVAGIIGGNDSVVTGIAVDTQLVLMKVFPDLESGAETDDILAALEDAVLLGVDAINMSLGSSCGFAREEDGSAINAVYDRINASGISLITAASNSYSSSYGGEQGNTNFVTNPDSGTVGSPSTYGAALSVASINGIKSKYLVGNDSQVIFFNESNSITGDANDFFAELGIKEGETKTFEYVTIPGVGLKVNYATVGDLTGKIALVRRGDSTFEDKALQAKNAGAIACIIYNNIEGDILMSMGKTDHIPTISISKTDGAELIKNDTGTITLSYQYQAGPFMSDFSSWGPTGDLSLKPEITAHGGYITSAVPNGGYDELSGTSMASPNLCGIVVLIRQYLKEKYPAMDTKSISVMTNQMLMSTATIIQNEEGNPYSPRKQGAGLASLYNVVNTRAYLTVDGIDRTKLELKDDPDKTGVYTMKFNIVNLSDAPISYNLSLIGLTESVSASDSEHVAEKSYVLGGSTQSTVKNGTLNGNIVTVAANATASVTMVYTLSDADKEYIEASFPYGMYVEGFVKLEATEEKDIDLNIPFLAFFGDWTVAPMFDTTYYEVEKDADNAAIDDEDKTKADYYATTPYGSYYYNYIIPLGTYLYDIDTSTYDAIPASADKISISNILGSIDGISAVYAGLLRNAKTMTFTITDKLTGEVVYSLVDYNANKAHTNTGTPLPYYNFLNQKSANLNLVNNRQYEFKMSAALDYGDGGIDTNVRNTFSFDFYLDDEAPVLKDVSYTKEYDKSKKKYRYYLTMTIYDNQYVQSITPITFTSSSSYTFLTDNPIPVYSERNQNNVVRIEITDYLDELYTDGIISSALAFSIDDYALNSNIYFCQLPGTKGDFKFTKDGTTDGIDLSILTVTEGEVVDLTKYLATSDSTVDADKDYLRYLDWTSSNEKVAVIEQGQIKALKAGRTTITVTEQMDNKQAMIIINVKARDTASATAASEEVREYDSADDAKIESIRFSYFDTLFAYSRAAQTSQIGSTGSRIYISSLSGGISFYPGEKIQLAYELKPWFVDEKYPVTFTSTNENVAVVDQNGVVTALKKGTSTIILNVQGSNLKASVKLTVNSEFVIENRTLIAYKGLGGKVVIPDDEGILYIGSYAFCLYETDRTIELTEDDYDANKIPSMNTSITSVVIPYGVEDIQKYAFYNCSGLVSVQLPETVKYIREFAFYNDAKLNSINLEKVETIGMYAFKGCTALDNIDLSNTFAIGRNAFDSNTSLSYVDLSSLRNAGQEIFRNTTALTSVKLTQDTKLTYAMFYKSGLKTVDIYTKTTIPDYAFAKCEALTEVTFHNSVNTIGKSAFSENKSLNKITFSGSVQKISDEAFYGNTSLTKIVLPDNALSLGNYSFYKSSALKTVEFQANTKIVNLQGSVFHDTALENFVVAQDNPYYKVSEDGAFLLSADKKTIILAALAKDYGDLVLDASYEVIGEGAFSGANIKTLTISNKNTVIGDYAFANCSSLEAVTFPAESGVKIGKHAFNFTKALTEVTNFENIKTVGDYAFANTGLTTVTLADDATFGEGAFYSSKLVTVNVGANNVFGMGAFHSNLSLTTVNMPADGGVVFGEAAFELDSALTSIDLSKTNGIIGRETFYGCTALQTVNFDNVTEIGDYAFAGCGWLKSINMPVVQKIGEGAFSKTINDGNAPQVEYLTLPATLTYMGDGAFLGCEGLTQVTILSDIAKISDYVFSYCVSLTEVTLSESVKEIGKYAFLSNTALATINLEGVEVIDDYAFTSSEALSKVNLSSARSIGIGAFASTLIAGDIVADNLTEIGDYAFQGGYISTFKAYALVNIGQSAFQNNKLLTEFGFSDKITKIGSMAFSGCTKLENFYALKGADKVTDGAINDYAILDNGILYTKMLSGKLMLSAVPGGKNIETLTVLDNTYRIDTYAGSENKYIQKIILPDALKSIGNYAFNGYESLKTVEFKSYTAPALESSYNQNAALTESDPGYDLLHNQYDIFGLELCYYNFIALAGKKEPIKMILPANQTLVGYDTIIYQAYFGKVANAQRSQYIAMEANLVDFISYAEQIAALEKITLANEKLVSSAVAAYKALKQSAVDFGYSEQEWNDMVAKVNSAQQTMNALKLAASPSGLQRLQEQINALPAVYDESVAELYASITAQIDALTFEEKALLDLTNYETLKASYENYTPVEPTPVNPDKPQSKAWIYVLISVAAAAVIGGVVFVVIKKRRSK